MSNPVKMDITKLMKYLMGKSDRLRAISAVALYSWFTAGSGKKIIVNGNTACNLTSKELAYLRNLA